MTLKTINNSGRENYVSPSVEVLDVTTEGVFCLSPKDWDEGESDWFE